MSYMLTGSFYPTLWNYGFRERCYQKPGQGEDYSSFDVDIVEGDAEFVLTANLPGFDAEDVNISLEKNHLKIEAVHTESSAKDVNEDENGMHFLYRERVHGKRERSFILSESSDISPDSIQASMDKGILTVTVQKKKKEEAFSIQVNRK